MLKSKQKIRTPSHSYAVLPHGIT